MDNAYHVLSDKIRNGEIPFDEAEECARMYGETLVHMMFQNIHTNIIEEYMEDL